MQIRNLEVAVCKPDHLGDFILALPALRHLQTLGCRLTLFIATGNFGLARHFFPDAELVALNMPYLKRDMAVESWTAVYKTLGRLRDFDLVFFLRRDYFFTPANFAHWSDYSFFIEERDDKHQTSLEHATVSEVCGAYDIAALFSEGRSVAFPTMPNRVAFAIGAGFPHKKWSPLAWARLGHLLRDRDIEVQVLSGPGEIDESRVVARAIGIDDRRDVFVGGSDFGALKDWLGGIDAVVAVDGGTAHLCSLEAPVLAVFGPSPYLRYAPTGAANRVVTRGLSCSPCVGFDVNALNACLSRECLYGLTPDAVAQALFLAPRMPGEVVALTDANGSKVFFGPSAGRMAA